MNNTIQSCIVCGSQSRELLAVFDKPPKGENTFGCDQYHRKLYRCLNCGLISNYHDIDLSEIYNGKYHHAAYHGAAIFERFNHVMALPYAQSDNKHRVARIADYFLLKRQNAEKKLCDIGSGMGVFPAAMTQIGWQVTAIDPDFNNVAHLTSLGNIEICIGQFPDVDIDGKYQLVTFNKVLEHIQPIVQTLAAAHRILMPGGIVYIELPDGEYALKEGVHRQEFFLEHFYAFSMPSLMLLAMRAGMAVEIAERIRDPSGKYTLYAFLSADE